MKPKILLILTALFLVGCAHENIAYQKLMGSENLIIIRTEPGNPPIVVQKENGIQISMIQ